MCPASTKTGTRSNGSALAAGNWNASGSPGKLRTTGRILVKLMPDIDKKLKEGDA